jgi:nucleotide-binding universal stress UspA family protein
MSIQMNNILLTTDFSEFARPAIEFARDLADRFEAQLFCLHVVDDAYQYWSAIGPESLPLGPPPEEMLELGRTRLSRFCDEYLAGLRKPVIRHVAYGRPFAEIISFAKEKQVDLIVMGTHGRGAIAHVLLGSTTEKVVRKAPCAVLTVRTTDQPFVMP